LALGVEGIVDLLVAGNPQDRIVQRLGVELPRPATFVGDLHALLKGV